MACRPHITGLLVCTLIAGLSAASDLQAQIGLALPPGAVVGAQETEALGVYLLPVGRFSNEEQPVLQLEGRISIQTWRTPLEHAAPLPAFQQLRSSLEEQGFSLLYQCANIQCGGFDFRYNTRVLPTPAMEVDLSDFFFATLRRQDPEGHAALLVSRSPIAGHIQLVEVSPGAAPAPATFVTTPVTTAAALPASDWAIPLQNDGRAVLEGITFSPGQTSPDTSSDAVLAQLAEFLRAAPDIRVVIVGHTDNSGALDINLRVSRNRAEAVRRALIDRFDIEAGQVSAAGVGYLAPRASNETPRGQTLNRRVEIVLEE